MCAGEGRVHSWGFLKQRVRKSGNYYPHPEGGGKAWMAGESEGVERLYRNGNGGMEIKCMYSAFLVDYLCVR